MLKYILDTTDGLDASTAALYEKADGGKFVLKVEGAVAKSRLDEFRNTNIELSKKLEGFKDVDPVKYKELVTIEQKLRDAKLVEVGKVDQLVDERVKTMRTEFDTERTALKTQISAQARQLESLLIDSSVREVAIKSGVSAAAVEDVLLRAKNVFEISEGRVVPFEIKNGTKNIIYGRTGEHPMTISEWVEGLSKAAPHLFGKTAGGGANNHGPGGVDTSKMTPTQKIRSGLAAS